MRSIHRVITLTVAMTLVAGSSAYACDRCQTAVKNVKRSYDGRYDHLKQVLVAEKAAIKASRRNAYKHLALERRAATRLCGPARKCALADIRQARKAVTKNYHYEMKALRKSYAANLASLRNSYEVVVTKVPAAYCTMATPVVVTTTTCDTYDVPTIVAPSLEWDAPDVIFEEDITPGYGTPAPAAPVEVPYEFENPAPAPYDYGPESSTDWELIEEGPALPGPKYEPTPAPPELILPEGYNLRVPRNRPVDVTSVRSKVKTKEVVREVERSGSRRVALGNLLRLLGI